MLNTGFILSRASITAVLHRENEHSASIKLSYSWKSITADFSR